MVRSTRLSSRFASEPSRGGGELRPHLVAVPAGRNAGLDVCAERSNHDVVVVVAGDEHHPLSLELVPDELEERLGLREGSLHAAELDVEDVAEEDELVDLVELRGQPLAGKRP